MVERKQSPQSCPRKIVNAWNMPWFRVSVESDCREINYNVSLMKATRICPYTSSTDHPDLH